VFVFLLSLQAPGPLHFLSRIVMQHDALTIKHAIVYIILSLRHDASCCFMMLHYVSVCVILLYVASYCFILRSFEKYFTTYAKASVVEEINLSEAPKPV